MENIKKIKNNSLSGKNKVLNKISNIKTDGFKKFVSKDKTSNGDILCDYKKGGYKIMEVETIINREPIKIEGKSFEYKLGDKEYIVFSPYNQLLEVYPKLEIAKNLIIYCIKNDIDFIKDKLDRSTLKLLTNTKES